MVASLGYFGEPPARRPFSNMIPRYEVALGADQRFASPRLLCEFHLRVCAANVSSQGDRWSECHHALPRLVDFSQEHII